MTTMYYEKDADLSLLKNKTIAILGYGSQGHAHALNLRDSGCKVIVGQRPGSPNYDLAKSHGFEPVSAEDATKQGDLVNILLPDEVQGDIYRQSIRPHLKPGNILMCSHGFNVHFGQVEAPPGVDTVLVAPKGPGHLVRSEFEKGGGVPCLIALNPGASETSRALGLAYAKGIGCTRGGVIETSFQPEMAYFECMHELKLIVDLFYQGGLNYMRYSVSNTAEFGDYTRGPRIVTAETRKEMKKILEEIQSGQFAREWILENKANAPAFKATRRRERAHPIEEVGRKLRRLMTWIKSKEV